ncbi:MAG: hypothetical protein ABIP35_08610 [Ginsengibacter sp.]
METSTLREKLHSLIETSSEEKLEKIYDFFSEEEYSDDFKAMLDNEFEQYQRDGEGISRDEVDKMIEQLLHPKK